MAIHPDHSIWSSSVGCREGRRHVSVCPVCDCESFEECYPANFEGNWRDAVPYFLTGRTKAVHGRIVRCRDCRFMFTSPRFSEDEYARIYASVHAGGGGGSPPRARFTALASLVRPWESGGRFLDFGCGGGGFLDAMSDYDAIGFEVAADIPNGVERNGRFVTGDILADTLPAVGLAPASFDFIVAWDVLEHLAAPEQQMRRLHSLLKPNGRLTRLCRIARVCSHACLARNGTCSYWNIFVIRSSDADKVFGTLWVRDRSQSGRSDIRLTWLPCSGAHAKLMATGYRRRRQFSRTGIYAADWSDVC